jgi:DNA invertase Pin-like site-specific DNA recombinase
MPTKAYSYLRFSTPEQSRGDSFRRQASLAADYARQHGLTLDTDLTFNDLGVSAYRGKNAEAGRLADFLVAVEDGIVARGSYLLVESLDRISRQAARKALRVLESIVEHGITVVTLNDGKAYTVDGLDNDPMSLLLALLTFIRANEESATKSRRLSAVWSTKRDKASEKPITSVCPAWLRLDPATQRFEIDPDRAAIVQRVYAETLAGKGKHAIVEALNKDHVPVFGHRGRTGQHWHRSYVAKLLASPSVMGTNVPHRIEYVSGRKRRVPLAPVSNYFPAVVDEDAYLRVQALNDTRQPLRGRNASGTVSNILGGLARCPICDGSMTLVNKGGRWRYLICVRAKVGAGCRYHAVRYPEVETAIVSGVGKIVYDCPSGDPEEERLSRLIRVADDHLEILADELVNLVDTAAHRSGPALAERIAGIEAAIQSTRAEQAEHVARHALLTPTRRQANLDELDLAAHTKPLDRAAVNAALRVLVSAVVVNFLTGYLVFRWKFGDETDLHWAWPEDEGAANAAASALRDLSATTPRVPSP